jgi:hypothetical protein
VSWQAEREVLEGRLGEAAELVQVGGREEMWEEGRKGGKRDGEEDM